jgi:hypothetical protein
MLDILKEQLAEDGSKKILINDLITIVNAIDLEKFMQASLSIRPFKPHFL